MAKKLKKPTPKELEKILGEFVGLAKWAVCNLKAHGSGTVMLGDVGNDPKITRWENMFFDALDKAGHVVDRKAFFKGKFTRCGS